MITTIIIIVTCLISYKGFHDSRFQERWMFNAYKILERKQPDRFITSGFVHKDWMHLGFNMFTLYFLGGSVESFFVNFMNNGEILYIGMYLLAIAVSSIPSFIRHREHEFYYSLGASGGVSALVFCFIILAPLVPLCLFGILCLPGFLLGALYIIYTIHMSRRGNDNINHDAHLYGALFGLIFILIVRPESLMEFFSQLGDYKLF